MSIVDQLAIQRMAVDIDRIFRQHGISDGFGVGDYVVTDRLVTDVARSHARMSDAIVDNTWPSISSRRVIHYTRRHCAASIVSEKSLRLYHLFKRVSQNEMEVFFRDHGLLGAFQTGLGGAPSYHEQLKKIFYASFTHTGMSDREEHDMWEEFAPADTDVRLTFKIDAIAPDFRDVKYAPGGGAGIALIKDLQHAVATVGGRSLLFRGVTRAAAFYLHGNYRQEEECRLLHARFDESQCDVESDEQGQRYIKLPLDGKFHLGYRLTPIAVENRDGLDKELHDVFTRLGN